MRNFLFSILVIIPFLYSCSSYKEAFTPVSKTREIYTPVFLSGERIEQVFKVSIEVYGHQFGGILAVKKIDSGHYRLAMLTEIGAKLLDFELVNGEMKLNYAIEQLNRKIILNILKQDFLILLNENAEVQNQYSYKDNRIYQASLEGKDVYYFEDMTSQKLTKVVWASKSKEKTVFEYTCRDSDFPDIKITHNNIKLQIELLVLEN